MQEERSGVVAESSDDGRAAVDTDEVLSYWFPEELADADLETLRRHGKRWMAGVRYQ